ncbi:MAG: hypothetical protein AAF215_18375, partial [Cyanobacteria bacterium P01_A01_bin.123]
MSEGQPASIDHQNQTALAELCRLLRFSQGEFELILAVCNSTQHRQGLVAQLRQQCDVTFDEITLDASTPTLFTTIREAIGNQPPDALMVYGLSGVQALDQVLAATNQIREEFRQFPFPLVLWLTDEGLKQLIRTAPDFYSWANSITFETPSQFFLSFLDELIRDVWQQVAQSRENRFLSNEELGLTPGSTRCQELETSLAGLAAQQMTLTPVQSAALAFVQGRIADNNTAIAREHYESSLAQWQALCSQNGQESPNTWQENIGYVQLYLGLWWANYSVRHQREFEAACDQAREYCESAIQSFEAAHRQDLAAKYINYWALALHRLARWDELEAVAKKALSLYQQQQDLFRVARAKGFLAEVALSKSDWSTAQHYAEAALALIQPAAEKALPLIQPLTGVTLNQVSPDDAAFHGWVNSFHRSWYLFSLGKAQLGQQQIEAAVKTLEQVCTVTQPEYDPMLYSNVLEYLRQGYFTQGKYLKAFETRRQKEAIESRFNYRAFVGAGRLQPKQQVANPALPGGETAKDLIVASGRKHDVKALVRRLAQDEYALTIIYGPSGVGKSSLIEAGLVPALEQERFDNRRVVLIHLRRYRDWQRDLASELGVMQAGAGHQTPNLGGFRSSQDRGDGFEGRTEAGRGHHHHSGGFGSPQDWGVGGLESENLEEGVFDFLRRQTQRNRVLVLIFDQFEEFFFEYDQTATRRRFYDFLRDCLTMPFVKVVLSLREDYIHYLLECGRLTSLDIVDNNILDKKWLYYLGNFSPDEAKVVIKDLTWPTPYQPEAALIDQVVADLAAGAGEVRPIELQIVGAQLQAEALATVVAYQNRGSAGTGTKEALVQQYLADVVTACGPSDNQRLAEMVLYLLTDEKGMRPLKTASELMNDLRTFTNDAELDADALTLVLQILTASGLVMQVPEAPADRYQLVHDYLAAFIRLSQQPLMAQLMQERQMRKKAARQQLQRTRQLAIGLGTLTIIATGFGVFAWIQQQKAFIGEINAQFLADSLAMEAYLEAGLEENAVTQAMQTAQALQGKSAQHLDSANRFQAISSIREVMFGLKERERLIGHSDWVRSVAFNPDGETLASASDDNTVKLWSKDGTELQTLQGHSDWVRSVAFNPDGETLASASADNTVKLWSKDGTELQTLQGHSDWVRSVAFNPDGETLASASDDNTVKLWSKDGIELQTLQGHSDWVLSVAFSPDGETLASA